MKPLVIIPARGGSKGLPDKNIKILGGKPLIHWTINEARKIFNDDVICVSTDSLKIKEIAEQTGLKVPFIRPKSIAKDTSTTREVILHAMKYYEDNGYQPDTIILLQPTSPFRTEIHIREALKIYDNNLDMVVSVKETKSNPYFVLKEEDENQFLVPSKVSSITRRQDAPKVWELNGAIYIINVSRLKKNQVSHFKRVKKYVMNEADSLDIDTNFDWLFVEFVLKHKS